MHSLSATAPLAITGGGSLTRAAASQLDGGFSLSDAELVLNGRFQFLVTQRGSGYILKDGGLTNRYADTLSGGRPAIPALGLVRHCRWARDARVDGYARRPARGQLMVSARCAAYWSGVINRLGADSRSFTRKIMFHAAVSANSPGFVFPADMIDREIPVLLLPTAAPAK